MITRLRNLSGFVTSLLIVYMALYLGFRFPHMQTHYDRQYVVFGSTASYQFFRPAAYVDSALTGIRIQVGPFPERTDDDYL